MLQTSTAKMNNLKISIFNFPEIGDTVPLHDHNEENVHITVICRGSIQVNGPNFNQIYNAGDIINWQPYQSHEFVAIEANSKMINIIKV